MYTCIYIIIYVNLSVPRMNLNEYIYIYIYIYRVFNIVILGQRISLEKPIGQRSDLLNPRRWYHLTA